MDYLVSFIIAVVMFFLTNWIGGHSIRRGYFQISDFSQASQAHLFNYSYRIFSPTAILTMIAAIAYWIEQDWVIASLPLSIVIYFVLRIAFYIVTDRYELISVKEFTFVALLSILFFYLIYEKIITTRSFFFPSTQELGSALWLGLAAFLYKTLNEIQLSDRNYSVRRSRYVFSQQIKYENEFGEILNSETSSRYQRALVLSILIYEGLNRPRAFGLLERAKARITGEATLGPMQVSSRTEISDAESVRIGARKLLSLLKDVRREHPMEPAQFVQDVALKRYNGGYGYSDEISHILKILGFEWNAFSLDDEEDFLSKIS